MAILQAWLGALAIPLLLILTVIAGYSYSQIRFLSLPIPQALGLFTVVLPLITGISTKGAYGLIKRSSKNQQYQLTIPLIAVIGFQLIYETVVATLASTYILPPASLACGLHTRWQKLLSAKDEKAIKAIQDAFQCCGFKHPRDMAWPFGNPSSCGEIFGRTQGCVGEWRKAEQVNAGLFVLVAVVVFAIKVLSIISLLTSSSWTKGWLHSSERRSPGQEEGLEEDHRATTRRLIGDGTTDEEYHDEPSASRSVIEASHENGQNQGPRVEPSQLLGHGNEWRNEGETN